MWSVLQASYQELPRGSYDLKCKAKACWKVGSMEVLSFLFQCPNPHFLRHMHITSGNTEEGPVQHSIGETSRKRQPEMFINTFENVSLFIMFATWENGKEPLPNDTCVGHPVLKAHPCLGKRRKGNKEFGQRFTKLEFQREACFAIRMAFKLQVFTHREKEVNKGRGRCTFRKHRAVE